MELKIAFLVIVAGVSNVLATPSYSQVTKVSLDMENKSLEQVMDEIEKQSEFYFIFNQKQVDVNRVIDIQAENKLITDILPELFTGTNVNYVVFDRKILLTTDPLENSLLAIASGAELQQKQITGTVTDKDGAPLPGVNVVVTGTTVGTLTDVAGKYSLEVPQGSKSLTFSFIGMEAQEITIGTLTQINVTMTESAIGLEEVVIVGYGTQRKADISGSISQVSGSDLEKVKATSFDQALQGLSAGLMVNQGDGTPGGNISIRIRGTGSINSSNEPLYVIDGLLVFPNNSEFHTSGDTRTVSFPFQSGAPPNLLASLNPNDIESIEVLKDASATAIYGSRGANGVIIVTTKRGKAGTSSMDIDYYSGIRVITGGYSLMNAAEYANAVNEYLDFYGVAPPFSPSEIAEFERTGGTNWQDEVTRNAWVHNYQISARGGNERVKHYLSANYLDEDGIIIGNKLQRISLRSNLDMNVTDKLTMASSFTASYTNNDAVPMSGRGTVIQSMYNMPPVDPVYNDDGSYAIVPSRGEGEESNPVAIALTQQELYKTLRTMGTYYLQYEFIDGLSAKINLGYDLTAREELAYAPKATTMYGMSSGGSARRGNAFNINWLTEYLLTFKRLVGKHSIDVVGGFTMQADLLSRTLTGRENFITDAFQTTNLSGGSVEIIPQSSETRSSLISGLGRANYVFDDKYIVTVTGRYDGSSRFGANNKYAFFPAGAVAWRLINEDFIKNMGFFSDLKLRASIGVTGNQEIGIYRSLPRYSTVNENFGGTTVVGVAPDALPNPDLTWEQTRQYDIGLDAAFFEGRLAMNIDYYNRVTSDLLFEFPLPSESGYSSILQNTGSVKNQGIEVTASTSASIGELEILVNGNFSYNHNEILDLGGIDSVLVGQNDIRIIGEPLGVWYNYDVLGVWQLDEADEAAVFGRVPGDFKYRDANGDNKSSTLDRMLLGQTQPKYLYGLTAELRYKGFELSAFLQGAAGHRIGNSIRSEKVIRWRGQANSFTEILDAWTPDNPSNEVCSVNSVDALKIPGGTMLGNFIEKGDYLRLKNLTLAYNLPENVLNTLKLQRVRIYVSGENILTLTGYTGQDPEFIGSEGSSYPFSKMYRIGFNIGF